MPVDKEREAQDEVLATNVRMESLQQSADGLLKAANRLHETVERETRYWDRILSITSKGWNVCRPPGLQHRLGVTYGFSESLPEFSRWGIAAPTTNAAGNMVLEHSAGSRPQMLRVMVKRANKIVGTSPITSVSDDDDPHSLEQRIHQARDSLFDAELYREMIRESRLMASLGVRLQRGGINMRPKEHALTPIELVFELVTLDDVFNTKPVRSQDSLATAVALLARLLLIQAHRKRLKRRSEVPAPLSAGKEERPLVPILRPILAFIMHLTALEQLNSYLDSLQALLSAVRIDSIMSHGRFSSPNISNSTSAESLISTFLQPWISPGRLTVDDGATELFTLIFEVATTLATSLGPVYTLETPS